MKGEVRNLTSLVFGQLKEGKCGRLVEDKELRGANVRLGAIADAFAGNREQMFAFACLLDIIQGEMMENLAVRISNGQTNKLVNIEMAQSHLSGNLKGLQTLMPVALFNRYAACFNEREDREKRFSGLGEIVKELVNVIEGSEAPEAP